MQDEAWDEAQRAALRRSLNLLRMIVSAMTMGVIAFQAVILFLHGAPKVGGILWEPPAIAGYALALMNAPLSFVLPFIVRGVAEKSGGPATPLAAAASIQTETIVACALLEGAAFVNLMAVFLHQSTGNLILGNVLLLFLMLRFPLSEESYFRKVAGRLT